MNLLHGIPFFDCLNFQFREGVDDRLVPQKIKVSEGVCAAVETGLTAGGLYIQYVLHGNVPAE